MYCLSSFYNSKITAPGRRKILILAIARMRPFVMTRYMETLEESTHIPSTSRLPDLFTVYLRWAHQLNHRPVLNSLQAVSTEAELKTAPSDTQLSGQVQHLSHTWSYVYLT